MTLKYKQLKPGKMVGSTSFVNKELPVKINKKFSENYFDLPKSQQLIFRKMCHFIKINCSQFLKSIKKANKFLYRGTYNSSNVFMGNPRKDRKPSDTNIFVQKDIDTLLTIGGFTALRSNSIFCTGDYEQAESYGEVYIIFPINGFSFTWGNNSDWIPTDDDILDSNIYFKKLCIKLNRLAHLVDFIDIPSKKDNDLKDEIIDACYNADRFDYTSVLNNIDKNIKILKIRLKQADLLVKKYSNINSTYRDLRSVIDKLIVLTLNKKIIAKNFCNKYEFSKTNLSKAVKSENEIYISGQYIAVKSEVYEEMLMEVFKIGVK